MDFLINKAGSSCALAPLPTKLWRVRQVNLHGQVRTEPIRAKPSQALFKTARHRLHAKMVRFVVLSGSDSSVRCMRRDHPTKLELYRED